MVPGIDTGGGGISGSSSAQTGDAQFGGFNIQKGNPVYSGLPAADWGPLWGSGSGATGFTIRPVHVGVAIALTAAGFAAYKLGGR